MKIILTGHKGYIGAVAGPILQGAGHEVVGLDNFSKYGPLRQASQEHPRYRFVQGDAKDVGLLTELMGDVAAVRNTVRNVRRRQAIRRPRKARNRRNNFSSHNKYGNRITCLGGGKFTRKRKSSTRVTAVLRSRASFPP